LYTILRTATAQPSLAGKEHDQLTSLSYYGARYYDRLTLTWAGGSALPLRV